MDGLIREAQRGQGVEAAPLLLRLFSCSLFSAVICQQALENKRGREGMRGGGESTGLHLHEQNPGGETATSGCVMGNHMAERRKHQERAPLPACINGEDACECPLFSTSLPFTSAICKPYLQFKQYWLLNYPHTGDFAPTRAGNYSFADLTTQRAAD